jgi:hypothetical protein
LSALNLFFLGRTRIIAQLVGWTLLTLIIYNTISSFRNYSEALSRTALNVIFIVTLFYGNAKVLINNYYEKRRY